MRDFLRALSVQRWDDHRYYHHSRINQSLHLLSALSFLVAYVLAFDDPAMAALVGWLVAMISRQLGHFVFEPRGYDVVNQATHDYKEAVKVGYNLRRKTVLLLLWAAIPAILTIDPRFFGIFESTDGGGAFMRRTGTLWLTLGIGGLLFRTVHLFFLKDLQTGLVWMTKILTDPFNDVKLYWRSPLHLLRGELIDPMYCAEECETEQHA